MSRSPNFLRDANSVPVSTQRTPPHTEKIKYVRGYSRYLFANSFKVLNSLNNIIVFQSLLSFSKSFATKFNFIDSSEIEWHVPTYPIKEIWGVKNVNRYARFERIRINYSRKGNWFWCLSKLPFVTRNCYFFFFPPTSSFCKCLCTMVLLFRFLIVHFQPSVEVNEVVSTFLVIDSISSD